MVWNEKREIKRTLLEIRREVEDSLRRLQVDAIDLYQIHWPIEDEDIEEGGPTWPISSARARSASSASPTSRRADGALPEDRAHHLAAAALLHAQPHAPSRDPALLPGPRHIGVINYAPMHSGLLTGAMTKERVANLPADDFRRNAKNYQEPLLSRNLAIADS
jgi:aryl-alcohol dehydrogenase-like predicted oxidoreductase